jgi:hypothetical protein
LISRLESVLSAKAIETRKGLAFHNYSALNFSAFFPVPSQIATVIPFAVSLTEQSCPPILSREVSSDILDVRCFYAVGRISVQVCCKRAGGGCQHLR